MKRYKLLKECEVGEWVFYEVGKLCQVKSFFNTISGKEDKILTDGYVETYTSDNSKVYPLSIHAKVIADAIYKYYNQMHEKNLINGSRWVNWLSEKFDQLMELDDKAPREEYRKIYDSIVAQIKELEYHKSFLS